MFQLIMTHRPTVALVLVAFVAGMALSDILSNGFAGFMKHIGLEK
ncbi:hypothetical protein [Lacticaseibacillus hulanensis]|nr:hypothetical protein [Lacticaseibacillus hulanensis]